MSSAKFSVDTGLVIATINLASFFFCGSRLLSCRGSVVLARCYFTSARFFVKGLENFAFGFFFSFTQPCVRLFSRGGAGFYNPTRLLSRVFAGFLYLVHAFSGPANLLNIFYSVQRGWILQPTRFFVKGNWKLGFRELSACSWRLWLRNLTQSGPDRRTANEMVLVLK